MQENEMIKQRKFDSVKPVETNIVEFIELSNSQIAMSKSIQDYQKQLEKLLDSFIKLIADAIDAKSAYTGSHCKKVPIIATMLADEAEASTEGALQDFHFASEEERTAFERAAWLHDCGKITTPEYVVDKATKLETIYNRIHEIRTRFEVIWRDIEITYYERLLDGEQRSDLERWKEEQQQQLQDDFTFVASCNVGSELMSEEKMIRLKKIAKQTWQRHFDDRLGLSEEELKRYTKKSETLPAQAYLISDRPEHLIHRENFDQKHYEEERFQLEVPQWLYNRGELYNLCVTKGTLTEEERYKINEHVIMTIKMLERLPFPHAMRDIPQIAGEHHETMDGQGYPRKLTKEELSIPSRIMAIADIFEALTASDRPYKKAKTLSEALKIMYVMKKESHIDAELFDLFIRSKVYLRYAQTYLHPEQIDEIDDETLLG
jgi:HD-GYP domain-containing protein (c-di-GMP phosphodiesterase class II)